MAVRIDSLIKLKMLFSMKMEKQLIALIKKVYGKKPEKIKNITAEERSDAGSFLVEVNGKKIKAIVFNDSPAELNNLLLYSPKIKRAPKIILHDKNIVLVEWLEGQSFEPENINDEDLKEIAKLQAEIHKAKVKINRAKVIESSKKLLEKYLNYLLNNNVLSQIEIEKLKSIFSNFFSDNIKLSLIHWDFNVDNLLKTKKGWFTIDNETLMLGITGLDFGKPITNTCHLDEQKIKTYLDAYNKISPIDFYIKDKDRYQLFYLLKQLVARHKKKQPYDRALNVIKEIIENKRTAIPRPNLL
jgi:thiamine kinase-like enzyme